MKPHVSHIIQCVLYIIFGILWAFICIYTKAWFMLIFDIVPLIFAIASVSESITSRKYYEMYLAEERAKLGLDDMPVETKDIEIAEEEDEEEYAEYLEYAQEIEELEEYDSDSDKGYCPYCGNYSVSDGKCEMCGEKVTE